MNHIRLYFISLLFVSIGCEQNPVKAPVNSSAATIDSCSISFDIDTVRFNNKLTNCQKRQVFLRRNFEEDYSKIEDTTRIALRFIWWRSFHGLAIIRLENRPTIAFSDSGNIKREVWQEWFATYKTDIQSLNKDFTFWVSGKPGGKIPPFVFQQHVERLPTNKTPTVIQLLDTVGFWDMKPVYPAPSHTDGSYWTLEVYRNGKYHEVSTDLKSHPVKSICLQLIKISKHPATPEEIY
ncbi:hypothetical protein [Hymenobacter sp. 5414T-23]|uniref:hypothetical protein n=1 Tax=Hymenobacter sp. 5414T-23 TaxID=2932252 RepID=UPI001FD5CD59|nr:hypothetical protein [Hymenobacter sp. 5414T-23]UOQ81144.1 hypothetical protein MUN83_20430 [Hymenobacter sp. 5414T-23]